MKHDFEERKQRRIENAENRAEKNVQESDLLWEKADGMTSQIPMGQPILVGHHSEKGDRRFRAKIDDIRRKSIETMDKANYYEQKAESIKNNDAISSDDPNALIKLEAKLKSLENLSDFMKKANQYIKKKDKAGFLTLAYASEQMWDELNDPKAFDLGFAHYKFSNNSAERRRIKARIAMLKSQQVRTVIDRVINGVKLYENREVGRLQLLFEDRPSRETIQKLKQGGFRWSPSQGAWQRHINQGAYNCATSILENL